MQLKDYYKILELEPSATLTEIKKAYHRLAQRYHPDKNSNEAYSATYFTEVKEAYEVLTNPAKRDYYLQQRWYQQSLGNRKFQSQPVTPPFVLKQFIELDRHVSRLDSFRMDKQGLSDYIIGLLDDDTIDKLRQFNEQDINNEIINIGTKVAAYLTLHQATAVCTKLYELAGSPLARLPIDRFLHQFKQKSNWEKRKIYLILLLTVIISILIYLSSR